LGHIIHLITDVSVPAHTRDDTHIEGDSYEQFVKYNWDILIKGLENVDTPIIYFDNLNEHFDNLAVYTNSNFYSEGTIKSDKYDLINEVGNEDILIKNDIYKKVYIGESPLNNNKYYLYISEESFEWTDLLYLSSKEVWGVDDFTLKHPYVLTSYAKHLIPKAIGHSAGIIKLFFEEVEKEHDFVPKEDRTSLKGKLAYLLGHTINKAHGLKRLVFGSRGVVMADEPTVEKIMSADNDLLSETLAEPEAPIEIASLSLVSGNPTGVDVGDIVPPSINVVDDEEGREKSSETEEVFVIEPIEDQKNNHGKADTGFYFVSGSGGEANPPLVEDELILDLEEVEQAVEETEQDEEGVEQVIGETEQNEDEEEIETASSTESIVDTDPPDAPSLSILQNISTSATSTINLFWGSVAEDLSYYNIEYKEDNGEWQVLFLQTTSTEYTIDVEKLKTYAFRARAIDTSENVSNWSNEESVLIDWSKTVVINEIAWMGTASNSSQDEWIELYNNTNQEIDLSNWSIEVSGKEINWDKSHPIIEAYGYYLLERTKNDTVLNIEADATYKGGLKNDGENLMLINSDGEIIDQVDNSDYWFAGSKEENYRTMERINSNLPGSLESNWQTSRSFSMEAQTKDGGRIYGTPRQANMGFLYLEDLMDNYGDLFDESNTLTLSKGNNPHIIDGVMEIPENYTLKIEEGVILTGSDADSYIDLKGDLIMEGTESEPIIFTSNKDVDYIDCEFSDSLFGNDRDCEALESGDGSAQEEDKPQPGDWSRIEIASTGKLDANNVKFLYGGNEYFLVGGFVFGGNFPSRVISNVGGEVNLDNVLFGNNFVPEDDKDDYGYDAVVWLESSDESTATVTINNSIFDSGYTAVRDGGSGNYLEINSSSFGNFINPEGVIVSKYDLPLMESNIFENNEKNTVYCQQVEINEDQTINSDIEYTFGSMTIASGSTLTINPGVVLNMGQRGSITVYGGLQSLGTEASPIKIQSLEQDKYWGNMLFSSSTSVLEYTHISGGNYGFVSNPDINGVLMLENSDVVLDNVLLINARRPYNMIYSKDSDLSISNSRISWTEPKASKSWSINGIKLNGGNTYINNTYFNEMDIGVEAYIGSVVEIENMTSEHFTNISNTNWWPVDLLVF